MFIAKMEQLVNFEKKVARREKQFVEKMELCYVNHPRPLKKILHFYNKASYKGFEASLVNKSLRQLNLALAARGNQPRPYEDYTLKEFDQSWRMEMLSGHLKEAIDNNLDFNHI